MQPTNTAAGESAERSFYEQLRRNHNRVNTEGSYSQGDENDLDGESSTRSRVLSRDSIKHKNERTHYSNIPIQQVDFLDMTKELKANAAAQAQAMNTSRVPQNKQQRKKHRSKLVNPGILVDHMHGGTLSLTGTQQFDDRRQRSNEKISVGSQKSSSRVKNAIKTQQATQTNKFNNGEQEQTSVKTIHLHGSAKTAKESNHVELLQQESAGKISVKIPGANNSQKLSPQNAKANKSLEDDETFQSNQSSEKRQNKSSKKSKDHVLQRPGMTKDEMEKAARDTLEFKRDDNQMLL